MIYGDIISLFALFYQGFVNRLNLFSDYYPENHFSDSSTNAYDMRTKKVGYVDMQMQLVIDAKYDYAYPFNNGYAIVSTGGKCGIINKDGNYVAQPIYDSFLDDNYTYQLFHNGLVVAVKDGKCGFIGTDGNEVIPFVYDSARELQDGLAAVDLNGKWGYIDINGNMAIAPQYDSDNNFFNGVALVGAGSKYWLIDQHGKQVSSDTWNFDNAYQNINENVVVYIVGGKWGIAKVMYPASTDTSTSTSTQTPAATATPASNQTAQLTAASVTVDGKTVPFDAYNINGNNYFKLRDLAYVLSGSNKQFDVGWDGTNNAITLTSGETYTVTGGEMAGKGSGNKVAIPTNSTIYLDGQKVSFTAYNIDGNNYFKLRDIGQAFDFGVSWDADSSTITIDTSQNYE